LVLPVKKSGALKLENLEKALLFFLEKKNKRIFALFFDSVHFK
jgi:hypothetical protein